MTADPVNSELFRMKRMMESGLDIKKLMNILTAERIKLLQPVRIWIRSGGNRTRIQGDALLCCSSITNERIVCYKERSLRYQ